MTSGAEKMTVEQITVGSVEKRVYPFNYRVRDATNTTLHRIGELLSKETVDELIRMGITVKIVAPSPVRKVR